MPLTAEQIAEAFNTASPRQQWKAHAFTKNNGAINQVHFTSLQGMVQFIYVLETGEFLVKFVKVIAAFGDYANAIARGLASILSCLQAGGLPFVAPKGPEGVEIIIKHNGVGNMVSARYLDPEIF